MEIEFDPVLFLPFVHSSLTGVRLCEQSNVSYTAVLSASSPPFEHRTEATPVQHKSTKSTQHSHFERVDGFVSYLVICRKGLDTIRLDIYIQEKEFI